MDTAEIIGYKIVYNGKDITRDVQDYVVSLEYKDTVEGESSSIDVVMENVDELWSNGWYPTKGDKIDLTIGDLECGKFTVDEVELNGPPDSVKISCLENVVTEQQLKTKKSKAHEKKSLHQIAQHVAKANKLTLVGNVPDIMFERVSQKRETDLKFLRRISYQYGIIFSVRDNKLVFTSLKENDARAAALTLDKTDLETYSLKDKTFNTFKDVKVSHHGSNSKKIISYHEQSSNVVTEYNKDGIGYAQITAADTKVIHSRVENKQQAEAVGNAALYKANTQQQGGTVLTTGNKMVVAGNNIKLTGLGSAGSGIWNIQKSTHTHSRDSGWKVSIDIRRIAQIDKSFHRSKKKVQPKYGSSDTQIIYETNRDGIKYPQIVPR